MTANDQTDSNDPSDPSGASEVEQHSPEAHQAISAELVRCTLGQVERPELLMPTIGSIFRGIRDAFLIAFRPVVEGLSKRPPLGPFGS